MDQEVELFEQSILDFADVFTKKAKRGAIVMQGRTTSPTLLVPSQVGSDGNSGASTPSLTSGSDTGSSDSSPIILSRPLPSVDAVNHQRRPSFATRLSSMLTIASLQSSSMEVTDCGLGALDALPGADSKVIAKEVKNAWKIEADGVDRSIKILPGVRKLINSLPDGRWAVATSGAKTYGAHLCYS